VFDANFFLHFEHSQIPFATLLVPSFLQKGQGCFNLCLTSTLTNLSLALFPYLAPNLPADFVFFDFVAILF